MGRPVKNEGNEGEEQTHRETQMPGRRSWPLSDVTVDESASKNNATSVVL